MKKETEIAMDNHAWAQKVSEKLKRKMEVVAERNRHKIPYTTRDGVFDDQSKENICWWTNGFWGGIMWQLYHGTGQELYREIARETEEKLDENFMNEMGMDHDSGFKWLPTAGANYAITGNEASLNRVLIAANDMAGRFNPAGGFIRAWNDDGDGSKAGWAVIDCMMNLPLLYRASEKLNDPRFRQIATIHADTARKHFIRPDGSAKHIVAFNPDTGEYVQSFGGQGYGEGSSWTRGQAWALYGFTLSYLHTQKQDYLETARKVADYFLDNIPESGLIPIDFRQPEDCKLEDSTAAAIAACGLITLSGQLQETENGKYLGAALKLLQTLEEKRCDFDTKSDNILEKCSAAFHHEKHEFSIIYGDYYFIEAIWKLTGQEIFIW